MKTPPIPWMLAAVLAAEPPVLPLASLRRDAAPPPAAAAPALPAEAARAGPDESSPPAPDNPFRRAAPPSPAHSVPVRVSAVLLGCPLQPALAVINGEVFQPGDDFEGWTVASLSGESVELGKEIGRAHV